MVNMDRVDAKEYCKKAYAKDPTDFIAVTNVRVSVANCHVGWTCV